MAKNSIANKKIFVFIVLTFLVNDYWKILAFYQKIVRHICILKIILNRETLLGYTRLGQTRLFDSDETNLCSEKRNEKQELAVGGF
jgi:hypothetical protein